MKTDTLEVLRAARASVLNERTRYNHNQWTGCTCGHIYAAAHGGELLAPTGRNGQVVLGSKAAVLRETAFALGWRGSPNLPARFISRYAEQGCTRDETDSPIVLRARAAAVLTEAIVTIGQQRAADEEMIAAIEGTLTSEPADLGALPEPVPA